jgi:hypothetical protein
VIYRPKWRAESSCAIHITVAPLLVELQAKGQIFRR